MKLTDEEIKQMRCKTKGCKAEELMVWKSRGRLANGKIGKIWICNPCYESRPIKKIAPTLNDWHRGSY